MKAYIYVQNYEGKSIGDIALIGQSISPNFLKSNGICVEVSYSDELANLPIQHLTTELIEDNWVISANEDIIFSEARASKLAAIDAKTNQLISNGGTFDNKTFSLSLSAQTNWHVLKTMQASFTWPVEISTKDGGSYLLSEANLDSFIGQMLGTVKAHLDSGRALRASVNDAFNLEEMNLTVDNR